MADTVHTSANLTFGFLSDADLLREDFFRRHPKRKLLVRSVSRSEKGDLPHSAMTWHAAHRDTGATATAIYYPSSSVHSCEPHKSPDEAECARIWSRLAKEVTPEWLADLDAAESVARAFTSHGPAGTAYGNIVPRRNEPAVMELQFVGPLFPCTTVAVGTLAEMLERARETIVHGDADFRDAILNVYLPPAVIRR